LYSTSGGNSLLHLPREIARDHFFFRQQIAFAIFTIDQEYRGVIEGRMGSKDKGKKEKKKPKKDKK